jgi:hypothetical protein
MYFSAFYCIHCQRYFIGNAARKAIRTHMIEAHGKKGVYGVRGNIRRVPIEVEENRMLGLSIPNFDGIIEVVNTPSD